MNSRVIIVISGQIGSGKSTLAKEVSEATDIPFISFGKYVRHLVRQSGGDDTERKALQDEGERQVRSDPRTFVEATIEYHKMDSSASFVVDGLRHTSVLQEMRKLFGTDLKHVHLQADNQVALKRAISRGEDPKVVMSALEHSVEREVTTELLETADLVLPANKPPSELVASIISKLNESTR